MKNSCPFFLFILLAVNAIAQPDVDRIKTAWYGRDYNTVIRLVDDYYRGHKPSLKLDLMKVSSMCLSGVASPNPGLCFDYIAQAYKIPNNVTAIIQRAKTNCLSLDLNAVSQYVRTASADPPRTVGKTGRSTIQKGQDRMGDSTRTLRTVTAEELQARRLRIAPGDNAAAYFKELYDSLGISHVSPKILGRFVVVGSALALSNMTMADVEKRLNNYAAFYMSEYNLKEPEEYISVFLAKDIDELSFIAEKLHGFRPPSYTLGYSNLEDQCIVSIAFVPDKPLLGTACHELFHILSKSTFETLPAWLEEGMASLYEVSAPTGSRINGLNNWRIEFLLQNTGRLNHKMQFFRLDDLLKMGWTEFNQSDDEFDAKQSFHYAYSRYLMLFLQEKGTLKDFFQQASTYGYMNIKDGPVADYRRMLEEAAGTTSFDNDFRKWVSSRQLVQH